MFKTQILVGLLIFSVAYAQISSLPARDYFEVCTTRNFCGLAYNFGNILELQTFARSYCPFPTTFIIPSPTSSDQSQSVQNSNPEMQGPPDTIAEISGGYTYTVSGLVLSISKVFPASNAQVLSQKKFSKAPAGLFVDGNYMTVFFIDFQDVSVVGGSIYGFQKNITTVNSVRLPFTVVQIYNVTDKNSIELHKTYRIRGNYLKAQRNGKTGFVYIFNEIGCDLAGNIPSYQVNFQGRSLEKRLSLTRIYFYRNTSYGVKQSSGTKTFYVNMFAFNLRNPSENSESMISVLTPSTDYQYILHMPEDSDSIYLATYSTGLNVQQSQIHKIYVNGLKMVPIDDVKFDGKIRDQSFMNEYEGNLRVVTVEKDFTYSVYCLNAKALDITHSLSKFVEGNLLESIQYYQNRAYLLISNLLSINSLFAVDFKNPRTLKFLGKLRLPGFSNYIKLYNENTAIAFSQADETQTPKKRFRVSLFDLTNISNPLRISDYALPEFYSFVQADWDNTGFLLDKSKNLMVVPAKNYNWNSNGYGTNAFNGALVFTVYRDQSKDSITFKGIVSHLVEPNDKFAEKYVERSLTYENMLYTKSKCLMKIHNLDTWTTVKQLRLNCEKTSVNEVPLSPIQSVRRPFKPELPSQTYPDNAAKSIRII